MNRRSFLIGASASLIAAPAIVRENPYLPVAYREILDQRGMIGPVAYRGWDLYAEGQTVYAFPRFTEA